MDEERGPLSGAEISFSLFLSLFFFWLTTCKSFIVLNTENFTQQHFYLHCSDNRLPLYHCATFFPVASSQVIMLSHCIVIICVKSSTNTPITCCFLTKYCTVILSLYCHVKCRYRHIHFTKQESGKREW